VHRTIRDPADGTVKFSVPGRRGGERGRGGGRQEGRSRGGKLCREEEG